MEFSGFSEQTADFLWDLRFNNNKTWFDEHRELYYSCLQKPFRALANEVFEAMSEKYKDCVFDFHVSRINRDARRPSPFGPYKDHLWFTVFNAMGEEYGRPAFYFEISPEGYGFGMGVYKMSQSVSENYRRILLGQPADIIELAKKLKEQDRFRLYGDTYKRSRGDAGLYLTEWLNKKGFGCDCSRQFDALCFSAELKNEILEGFDFLMPYYRFIEKVCLTAEKG